MSKMKNCPACQRELPVLAVRCKFCGFKLSNQNATMLGMPAASLASTPPPPPPMARVNEAPSAPPMARVSTPPPAPPPARASVPPPAPPPRGGPNRTMTLGAMPTIERPVGMGQAQRGQPAPGRSTMPPPPLARPSAPSLPGPEEEVLDLPDIEDDSWIPAATGPGEDTSLVDLDSEDVEELDAGESAVADDEGIDPDDEPRLWLLRHTLSDETIDALEARKLPPLLVKLAGKIRHAHWLGAAVVLTGLIVLVLALALTGKSDIAARPMTIAKAPMKPGATAPMPASGTDAEAPRPAGTAPPPPSAAAPVVPAPGKDCRPLAEYPDFPWRDRLAAALDKAGTKSICGLLGAAPGKLAEAGGGGMIVGPGGFDLLLGVDLLEVFVSDKPDRRSPSLRYLFAGGALGEIQLDYRDSAGPGPDVKALAALFESEPETLTDHLGRRIVRLTDGDLLVELWEEKWHGRTLRKLVFASPAFRQAFSKDKEVRERAEKLVADGDALLGRRKHEEALEAFSQAAEAMPAYGLARLRLALALMRLERFDEVEAAVNLVLERSREIAVRADARGLLGVATLHGGDTDRALAHYKTAAAEDPAIPLFTISVQELETGQYDMSRVALTAARMECRQKGKTGGSVEALLARGNFPDSATYFAALKKAQRDGRWKATNRQYVGMECR